MPNVVIVAEHASARWGGEAIIPIHYFRILRARGVRVWLVVHARTRDELTELLPGEVDAMRFIPDTRGHRLLHRVGKRLPVGISYWTTGIISRLLTQRLAVRIVRQLHREFDIDVVHQPIPVSPKEPSILHRQPAPLIVGPLNGGMTYPPAFRRRQGRLQRCFTGIARPLSRLIHGLFRGKSRAAIVLVANERTRRALWRVRGRIVRLVENGVDLNLWAPVDRPPPESATPIRFVFLGRLIDWKGVDLLLKALAIIKGQAPVALEIIGDGAMRGPLNELARQLGVSEITTFKGWMSQADCAEQLRRADVFVLPSLFECGGAVVLEAMACGLPVIATNWGGPADYLDESCSILIEPTNEPEFVDALAATMLRLARDVSLRSALGRAARTRVEQHFDWERKVDRILELYREAARSKN